MWRNRLWKDYSGFVSSVSPSYVSADKAISTESFVIDTLFQVPQFILDDMIDSGHGGYCNIICTQPRRMAVSISVLRSHVFTRFLLGL